MRRAGACGVRRPNDEMRSAAQAELKKVSAFGGLEIVRYSTEGRGPCSSTHAELSAEMWNPA
jgi:hypothetical protein